MSHTDNYLIVIVINLVSLPSFRTSLVRGQEKACFVTVLDPAFAILKQYITCCHRHLELDEDAGTDEGREGDVVQYRETQSEPWQRLAEDSTYSGILKN